jgi:hypothetical protein
MPLCDGLCGIAHRRRIAGDCAHHISDRAPERFHGTFNMLGPLLAGSGVQQNLRVETTVALHRILEDADRSRQRADLVSPASMRDLDIIRPPRRPA